MVLAKFDVALAERWGFTVGIEGERVVFSNSD